MRIDRLLAIVVILLNKSRVQAHELAERFEVSVRTIYRDFEALNLAGIPVIGIQGNSGGYGLAEDYAIERQVLGVKELASILTAIKGVSDSFDSDDINNALSSLEFLVPDDVVHKQNEELIIDIMQWGYRSRQKELLKSLRRSITERKLIRCMYRNMKGEEIKRTIEPMTLLYKGFAWYLFGFCQLKKDFRLFRVSRIDELVLLQKTFIRRNKTYSDFAAFSPGAVSSISVVLKFSPAARYRVEDYFQKDEIQYNNDGSLIVHMDFPDDPWGYSFILGFGHDVEVLEPENLRISILSKIKKIMELYQT